MKPHTLKRYGLALFSLFFLACGTDDTTEPTTDPGGGEPIVIGDRLPILSINSSGNQIVDDPRVLANITLTQDDEEVYSGRIAIEIRGSSSQSFPKKSYGFETRDSNDEDLDVSFLGLPAEEDWVLHGPFSDKSLIRNTLIYELSREMGRYASRGRFVELTINGSYEGVYVLFEKLKRDDQRIALTELSENDNSGDALTGGYILKIDRADGPFTNENSFVSNYGSNLDGTGSSIYFVYDYPKSAEITPEQREYIGSYVNDFESALASDDFTDPTLGYANFIDVDSFIDFLILNELSNNVDGYRLSSFMHKERNEKLKMGPIWDFNLGFGNADYCDGGKTDVWAYDFNSRCGGDSFNVPFWWPRFMEDPAFVARLQSRWNQLRGNVLSDANIQGTLDEQIALLSEANAINSNFNKWPIFGTYVWPNNFVGQNYAEEEAYLKDWISARLVWLDGAIAGL